jgi:hypothetical protein
VEQMMTTPWPNAVVANSASIFGAVEVEAPATPKQLARVCLAHAQLILGVAMMMFHQAVFRLALGLSVNFDYTQSEQAFNILQSLTLALAVLSFVIFGLFFWLLFKCNSVLNSNLSRRLIKQLWSQDPTSRWVVAIAGIGIASFLTIYFGAGMLEGQDLISKSMENSIQVASSIIGGVVLVVAASLRITQAMKITLGSDTAT